MGQAIWDYFHNHSPEDIQTETSISTLDELPLEYLFRDFDAMPIIEQKALEMARGKVLDVGAGAGSHSLYLQNQKKMEVTALDISPKSILVAEERGVQNVVCKEILDYTDEKFDTILLLMNGTGIFQEFKQTETYLKHLKSLLNPGGQILIDSTDVFYMYQDEEGYFNTPYDRYYGEVDYFLYYKGEAEDFFKWLYLDFDNLEEAAENVGLKAERIYEENEAYLARLY